MTHPLTNTTHDDHVATFVRIVHSSSVGAALAALRHHLIVDHDDPSVLDWEADFGPIPEAGIEGFRAFDEAHRYEHDEEDLACAWCGAEGDPDDPELGPVTLYTYEIAGVDGPYHRDCARTASERVNAASPWKSCGHEEATPDQGCIRCEDGQRIREALA